MARQPKTLPTPADDGFNPERLEAAGEAAKQLVELQSQQEATVRAVAIQLGYQLPADCTDPDLIQRDIAANMRRTAEAMVQVGLGLICLKEACQHGEFLTRLEVLRFEPRVAQRYMRVAKKLSNASTSSHLLKVIDSQSKLLELIVLDDEQLEELELIGQTGELKLDDIATMSVKELRATLREARENLDARSRVLEDKTSKIDALSEELVKVKKRVKAQPPADVGEEIRKEVAMLAAQAEVGLRAMRAGLQALTEHTEAHGILHDDFMAGAICQLELTLRQLRGEFSVKSAPDGDDTPEWMRPGAAEAVTARVAADMAASGWKFDADGRMVPINAESLDA